MASNLLTVPTLKRPRITRLLFHPAIHYLDLKGEEVRPGSSIDDKLESGLFAHTIPLQPLGFNDLPHQDLPGPDLAASLHHQALGGTAIGHPVSNISSGSLSAVSTYYQE